MEKLIPVTEKTIKKEGLTASLAKSENNLKIIVIPSYSHCPQQNITLTFEILIKKIYENKYYIDIFTKFKWKNQKIKEKFPHNAEKLLNTLNQTLNLVYHAMYPVETILNQKEAQEFIQYILKELKELASTYYNEKVLEDLLEANNRIF